MGSVPASPEPPEDEPEASAPPLEPELEPDPEPELLDPLDEPEPPEPLDELVPPLELVLPEPPPLLDPPSLPEPDAPPEPPHEAIKPAIKKPNDASAVFTRRTNPRSSPAGNPSVFGATLWNGACVTRGAEVPMRIVRIGCVAAAIAVALSACGSEERHVDSPKGSTSMQRAAPPTAQDQGWAALVEVDRELKDLEMLRDRTPDLGRRNEIELQVMDLRARSDRLLDDMSIGDGRVHDAAIRADIANLHRAMHADAVTEMQGESPRR